MVELGPDEFAFKQLRKNLGAKILNKYWPYALGVILVFAAILYLAFRVARGLVRRVRARSLAAWCMTLNDCLPGDLDET